MEKDYCDGCEHYHFYIKKILGEEFRREIREYNCLLLNKSCVNIKFCNQKKEKK